MPRGVWVYVATWMDVLPSAVGHSAVGPQLPLAFAMAKAAPHTAGVDDERLPNLGSDPRPDAAAVAAAHGGRREASQCWGQLLSGSTDCGVPDMSDRRHLQSRFCLKCRTDGIRIPEERVRVLPLELHADIVNSAAGLWMRHRSGTMPYCRVVNQTFQCNGPRLIVFRTPISSHQPAVTEDLPLVRGTASALEASHGQRAGPLPHNPWIPALWPLTPDEMVGADGRVHLVVAKGTLVPRLATHANPKAQPHAAAKAKTGAPEPSKPPRTQVGFTPVMEMRHMPPHQAPLVPAHLAGLRGGSAEQCPLKSWAPPTAARPAHTAAVTTRLPSPPKACATVAPVSTAAGQAAKKRPRGAEAAWRQAGMHRICSPVRCAAPVVEQCATAIAPRAAHVACPLPVEPPPSRRDTAAAGILKALEDLEARLYSFVLDEDAAEEPQVALFGTSLPTTWDSAAAHHWASSTLVQPAQAEPPLTGAPIQSIERLRLAIDDTSVALRTACSLATLASPAPTPRGI